MNLLRLGRVELLRYRSRRAVVVMLLGAFAVTALIAFASVFFTRPFSADDIARAEQRASAEAAQPFVQRELDRCLERPRRYGIRADLTGDELQQRCESRVLPRAEFYLYRPTLDLENEFYYDAFYVVLLVTALMMLAAITFAGADWASGSITNQLLVVPGRARLWLAKGLPVAALSGLVASVALTGFWIVVAVAARSRGIEGPEGFTADVVWQVVRVGPLVAAAVLGTYAAAMLLRSTVASIGLLFAYATVGEIFLKNQTFVDGLGRWTLSQNFQAVIMGTHRFFDYSLCTYDGTSRCRPGVVLTQAPAALYLAVVLALVVALSIWSFRRRDV